MQSQNKKKRGLRGHLITPHFIDVETEELRKRTRIAQGTSSSPGTRNFPMHHIAFIIYTSNSRKSKLVLKVLMKVAL